MLLAGCGGAADRATSANEGGSSVVASPTPAQEPSLPPGDPGMDAPEVPDPGTEAPAHEHPALTSVPADALLDEESVAAALGSTWTTSAGEGDSCTLPQGSVANRSMSYASNRGVLVETVTTHPDPDSADRAVAGLADGLAACGWTVDADPRLGSASVAAHDAERTLTAVSAEGVGVVLVGHGALTGDPGGWFSLVDFAIGSACPAAPDGCH